MFKKLLAVLALAVVATLAGSVAASATGHAANGTVEGPVKAGSPVTIVFGPETFAAAEEISFAASGFGEVTIAAFVSGAATAVEAASNDGSASVVVNLPSDARASYEITAMGLKSGVVGTASFTVAADDGRLPASGADVPVLAIWVASGALALGVALVAVMTIVRRQRHSRDGNTAARS